MPTNTASTQEVFIHRHCMQRMLHEAISNSQKTCHGLLTGGGNIITNNIHVTDKLFPSNDPVAKALQNDAITGHYFTTNKRDNSIHKAIAEMQSLAQYIGQQNPLYYLIIYLDHDGRVDALMYADPALSIPVTLNMKED